MSHIEENYTIINKTGKDLPREGEGRWRQVFILVVIATDKSRTLKC